MDHWFAILVVIIPLFCIYVKAKGLFWKTAKVVYLILLTYLLLNISLYNPSNGANIIGQVFLLYLGIIPAIIYIAFIYLLIYAKKLVFGAVFIKADHKEA